MPLAPSHSCRQPGCPEFATAGGRCPAHQRQPFSTSTYRRQSGLSKAVKRSILLRDGGRCAVCGGPATEVDHRVPRADMGGDVWSNLQALCRRCHRIKTGRQARAARDRPAQAPYSGSV